MDPFENFFRAADADGDGRISGAEAVAFFQGSGLPQMTLAKVWQFADQRQSGYLSRPEFFNALKLVTVAQSGRDLHPDLVRAALSGPAAAQIPPPRISIPPAAANRVAPGGGVPGQMAGAGVGGYGGVGVAAAAGQYGAGQMGGQARPSAQQMGMGPGQFGGMGMGGGGGQYGSPAPASFGGYQQPQLQQQLQQQQQPQAFAGPGPLQGGGFGGLSQQNMPSGWSATSAPATSASVGQAGSGMRAGSMAGGLGGVGGVGAMGGARGVGAMGGGGGAVQKPVDAFAEFGVLSQKAGPIGSTAGVPLQQQQAQSSPMRSRPSTQPPSSLPLQPTPAAPPPASRPSPTPPSFSSAPLTSAPFVSSAAVEPAPTVPASAAASAAPPPPAPAPAPVPSSFASFDAFASEPDSKIKPSTFDAFGDSTDFKASAPSTSSPAPVAAAAVPPESASSSSNFATSAASLQPDPFSLPQAAPSTSVSSSAAAAAAPPSTAVSVAGSGGPDLFGFGDDDGGMFKASGVQSSGASQDKPLSAGITSNMSSAPTPAAATDAANIASSPSDLLASAADKKLEPPAEVRPPSSLLASEPPAPPPTKKSAADAAAAALDAFLMSDAKAVAIVPSAVSEQQKPTAVSAAPAAAPAAPAPNVSYGSQPTAPGSQSYAQAQQGQGGQPRAAAPAAPAPAPIHQQPKVFVIVPGDPKPWPRMSIEDAQRYTAMFAKLDLDRDGKITGDEARDILLQFNVPIEALKQVWDISDEDDDGDLTLREFCTAIYLIDRFKDGHRLPAGANHRLPAGLHVDSPLPDPRSAIAAARIAEAQMALAANNAGANVASWRQEGASSSTAGIPSSPTAVVQTPAGQMPVPVSAADVSPAPPAYRSLVPPLELGKVAQLDPEEQSRLQAKHREAEEAGRKVWQVDADLMNSKQKVEFYRSKMQEIIMFKSRCDNKLNETLEAAAAEKREVDLLAKKYDDKFKATEGGVSRLAREEAALKDLQEKRMVLEHAVRRMELGADPNSLLQERADKLAADLEDLRRAVNRRAKELGLKVRPLLGSDQPFAWQTGMQDNAVDWDDEWDEFIDQGFSVVRDLGDNILPEDPFPPGVSKPLAIEGPKPQTPSLPAASNVATAAAAANGANGANGTKSNDDGGVPFESPADARGVFWSGPKSVAEKSREELDGRFPGKAEFDDVAKSTVQRSSALGTGGHDDDNGSEVTASHLHGSNSFALQGAGSGGKGTAKFGPADSGMSSSGDTSTAGGGDFSFGFGGGDSGAGAGGKGYHRDDESGQDAEVSSFAKVGGFDQHDAEETGSASFWPPPAKKVVEEPEESDENASFWPPKPAKSSSRENVAVVSDGSTSFWPPSAATAAQDSPSSDFGGASFWPPSSKQKDDGLPLSGLSSSVSGHDAADEHASFWPPSAKKGVEDSPANDEHASFWPPKASPQASADDESASFWPPKTASMASPGAAAEEEPASFWPPSSKAAAPQAAASSAAPADDEHASFWPSSNQSFDAAPTQPKWASGSIFDQHDPQDLRGSFDSDAAHSVSQSTDFPAGAFSSAGFAQGFDDHLGGGTFHAQEKDDNVGSKVDGGGFGGSSSSAYSGAYGAPSVAAGQPSSFDAGWGQGSHLKGFGKFDDDDSSVDTPVGGNKPSSFNEPSWKAF